MEGESDSNVLPETTGSSWMYGQQSAGPSTTGGMYFRGKDGHRIKSHTLFFSPPPLEAFDLHQGMQNYIHTELTKQTAT